MAHDVLTVGRLALLAGLAVGSLAHPALAQETPEQREACMHDTQRLCENAMPDVGRAVECLKAHRARLNHRCRKALDAPPAPTNAPAAPASPATPSPPQAAADKPASPSNASAATPPSPQASDSPTSLVASRKPRHSPHLAFAPHWRYTLRRPEVPIAHHRVRSASQRLLAARRAMYFRCQAAGGTYNAYSGGCGYGGLGGLFQ